MSISIPFSLAKKQEYTGKKDLIVFKYLTMGHWCFVVLIPIPNLLLKLHFSGVYLWVTCLLKRDWPGLFPILLVFPTLNSSLLSVWTWCRQRGAEVCQPSWWMWQPWLWWTLLFKPYPPLKDTFISYVSNSHSGCFGFLCLWLSGPSEYKADDASFLRWSLQQDLMTEPSHILHLCPQASWLNPVLRGTTDVSFSVHVMCDVFSPCTQLECYVFKCVPPSP